MVVLRIRKLAKSYGRTRAVRDVTLTVRRGDLYGLLGPNGSGKTTTLGCALGLLHPEQGSAEVFGIPSHRIQDTMGRVGTVWDRPVLVDGLSAHDNLLYACKTLGHDGGRGIDEVIHLVGLDGLMDRKARAMSLGQRRRLSIARALVGRPELMVLDEPLSGLDTVGVTSMLDLFRRLRDEGLTLVLSSHRLVEMERVVDRVGIILDGRVAREGTLQEILANRAGAVRIHALPREQARSILESLDGIARIEEVDEDLRVVPGEVPVPAITRALVQGGCDVAAIAPERSTLLAMFEALVKRRHDGSTHP